MFILAYDHESFEEARALNAFPFEEVLQGIAYAGRDLSLGYISSFQIWDTHGQLVFDSAKKETA
jgi:hypothetical protein